MQHYSAYWLTLPLNPLPTIHQGGSLLHPNLTVLQQWVHVGPEAVVNQIDAASHTIIANQIWVQSQDILELSHMPQYM